MMKNTGCALYTEDQGCPLHGEYCASESYPDTVVWQGKAKDLNEDAVKTHFEKHR